MSAKTKNSLKKKLRGLDKSVIDCQSRYAKDAWDNAQFRSNILFDDTETAYEYLRFIAANKYRIPKDVIEKITYICDFGPLGEEDDPDFVAKIRDFPKQNHTGLIGLGFFILIDPNNWEEDYKKCEKILHD